MNRHTSLGVLFFGLGLGLGLGMLIAAAEAPGQMPLLPGSAQTAPAEPELSPDAISARRAEIAAELTKLRDEKERAPEALARHLADQIEALSRLDLRYRQQASVLGEIEALRAAPEPTEPAGENEARERSAKAPTSLLALDTLRDRLDTEAGRAETIDASLDAAIASLEQARRAYDDSERARRRAKELLEEGDDPAALPQLSEDLRNRELESRAAKELVLLRELELQRDRLARQVHSDRVAALRQQVARMEGVVEFTEKQLRQRVDKLDGQLAKLSQALENATRQLEHAEAKWSKDERQPDTARAADSVAAARTEADRRVYEARQREVTLLGQRIQRLGDRKQIWSRRWTIYAGQAKAADVAEWKREVADTLKQLRRERRVQRARLADLRTEALAAGTRIAETAPPADLLRWLREQQQSVQEQIAMAEANLDDLEVAYRLYDRFWDELRASTTSRSLGEWVGAGWSAVRDTWSYEITSADERPITVGKTVIALTLLILGFRFARYVSHSFQRRVFRRLDLPTGTATALESVIYYAMVAAVSLLALRVVNIPLTAFTIIGGALAIGIGFGSQNIVNNFISGLILLIERPVRVGDLVEIEGTLGTVQQIGARSTRVLTFDNTHVLLPNSFFLENRVVNWSLSDDVVRGSVSVGVAYGSPTKEVARLLRLATEGQQFIVPWPEPIVRFLDFGDNALVFRLYFWVQPLSQMWAAETAVRFRIDELFRQAGISISFPQRDVHLDGSKPLEVRVLPASTSPPAGEREP